MAKPKAGNEIDSSLKRWEWEFSGEAEGIIYFKERRSKFMNPQTNQIEERIDFESKALDAMKYLRAISPDWKKNHPGMAGLDHPFYFNAIIPKEIKEEAKAAFRELDWYLCADEWQGVNPLDPKHMDRWQFHKVEDGIWAVTYEKA